MSVFYIADLHLHHSAMAELRGFSSVEEHDNTILENLQARLSDSDDLCLVGDLFAYSFSPALLKRLHAAAPHIVLVRGNHEEHWLPKADPSLIAQVFEDICDSAQFQDGPRRAVLSHYPRPDLYVRDQEVFMLHGHLHGQPPRRDDWVEFCARPNVLNVCAEVGVYTSGRWGKPAVLDEWIFFNEVWKARKVWEGAKRAEDGIAHCE